MPEEVKYEDLPIIFQSDGAVKDEIDRWKWDLIVFTKLMEDTFLRGDD